MTEICNKILIGMALVTMFIGASSCGRSDVTTSKKAETKTVKDFSFDLPDDWKYEKDSVTGVDLFLSSGNDSVYIFVNHTQSESCLSFFAENRFRSMLNEINNFDMVSSFKTDTLCEIVYTCEEDGIKFKQIFDIRQGNNGVLYGITGDYTYGDSAEVSNIIRSFQFNN